MLHKYFILFLILEISDLWRIYCCKKNLIFDVRESSPIHITFSRLIIKHTCKNIIFLDGSPNDQLPTIHCQISWLPALLARSQSIKISNCINMIIAGWVLNVKKCFYQLHDEETYTDSDSLLEYWKPRMIKKTGRLERG